MDDDRIILTSGIVIIGVGVVSRFGKPDAKYSPIIMGGVGFVLLTSLLAMTGPGMSKVMAGLAGLAAVTVFLSNSQPLLDLLGGKPPAIPKVVAEAKPLKAH